MQFTKYKNILCDSKNINLKNFVTWRAQKKREGFYKNFSSLFSNSDRLTFKISPFCPLRNGKNGRTDEIFQPCPSSIKYNMK